MTEKFIFCFNDDFTITATFATDNEVLSPNLSKMIMPMPHHL